MLSVRSLSLVHFKNYVSRQFTFPGRIVCISGSNGSGKTSLLDAIHFLCFTKSYFLHTDALHVTQGRQGFRLQAEFVSQEKPHSLVCILRENGKKEFRVDEEAYTQFSKHIGRFSCVMIAPDDTQLITEGSEERRKFLDAMISQTNAEYMQQLILYNRYLQQRNALLKSWSKGDERDYSLLGIYNQQLSNLAHPIANTRQAFCAHYAEKVLTIYSQLSEAKENIQLTYSTRLLDDSLAALLEQHIEKDIFSQRTNYGIHKDDLVFLLNGMPMKQSASQGQRKSFLFALKLAQYEMIEELNHQQPLLLLDDIFEKLDALRSQKLIEYVQKSKSQVFITDTHPERLQEAFAQSDGVTFLTIKNETDISV